MELMQRRRELMAMQSELPSAYRKVEYLQSQGSQRIITDIDCPKEIIAYQTMATTVNADQYGWGNRSGGYRICGFGSYDLFPQCYYGDQYKWYSWGYNYRFTLNEKVDTKQVYKDGYQAYYINGELKGTWDRPQIYVSGDNKKIHLFAGNGTNLMSRMKLYYIKFMDSNEETILGEFIPCVRKSDSKPGMYDTVSKTFYTNAGTGEFIVPA